jgi:hypothetical protein
MKSCIRVSGYLNFKTASSHEVNFGELISSSAIDYEGEKFRYVIDSG